MTAEPFRYPDPLTLARARAEAERDRTGAVGGSPSMRALWGRLGGLTTSHRYGPEHFRWLAGRRWGR